MKSIREVLHMNQEQFGKSIGLTKSGISNIESGARNVTEKHIKMVCMIHNVNEQWLRFGDDEMFIQTDDSLLSQISEEYKLSPEHCIVIKSFLNLDNAQRDAIVNYVTDLSSQFKAAAAQAKNISQAGQQESTYAAWKKKELAEYATELDEQEKGEDMIIEKEVDAYRKELKAEQKGQLVYENSEKTKSIK